MITIRTEGGRATSAPSAYLGVRWDDYMAACRAAGARYDRDRRCQTLRQDQLPGLVAALSERGFDLDFDAAAREIVERALAERRQAVKAASHAPNGLRLYPFQAEGVAWLRGRDRALLADSMGLGKTVQALVAIPDGAPVMVVLPASVKGVWAAEARRWRPDYHAPEILSGRGSFRWPKPGEIVITNYDILPAGERTRGSAGIGPDPRSGEIHGRKRGGYRTAAGAAPRGTVLVLDEAHAVKNSRSRRTLACRGLRDAVLAAGGKIWLLTGTPLLGHPPELWHVLEAAELGREVFGGWKGFERAFSCRIGHWGEREWGAPASWVPEALSRAMLRREREEVLPDLPVKTYRHIEVEIGRSTARLLDELPDPAEVFDGGGRMAFEDVSRTGAKLARAKTPALLELVSDYEAAEEPLIVFSRYRHPIDTLGEREGWETITGDTPQEERTRIVERFQGGRLRGVAATIQAGGTGITLTRAAHVVFVDRDWTPALNAQASDRLCRIGQTRGVVVTILVAAHDYERRMAELLTEKERLIGGSVDAAAKTQAGEDTREAAIRRALATSGNGRSMPVEREPDTIDLGNLPAGGYALATSEGARNAVEFILVDRPKQGRWAGWTFLSRQEGPRKMRLGCVRPDGSIRGVRMRKTLERIMAHPEEAMMRYGRELGVCGACGLPLTNDESRRLGIGPICRSKTF